MHDSGHINNIFKATINNDLGQIRAIIKSGISINQKHPQIQLTPLIQAINLRRIEIQDLRKRHIFLVGEAVRRYRFSSRIIAVAVTSINFQRSNRACSVTHQPSIMTVA